MELRTLESAESQGCGLCVVTVGHISFHTQGEEIADGLADPVFFQKVVTLVNPGRSGNRKAPETYRLTGVKQTLELPSWALGHSFLRPVGFGPKGAFPGWGGNRADFPERHNCRSHQMPSLSTNPGKPHQALRDHILENSPFSPQSGNK